MADFRYLVVGGGMCADAACRGIRSRDADGAIGLIGAEPEPPYSRPPLSKGLWHGADEASIWRGTEALGVELALGRRVETIDLADRSVSDDRGDRVGFETLLLATGGRPRRLAGDLPEEVVFFRTHADYGRVRALADDGARFVVVGGGFIGSELAAALVSVGCQVTMAFPEPAIGARLFPAELAEWVNGLYRERGVELRSGALVERLAAGVGGLAVELAGGELLEADAVVAGLGIEPAVELAAQVGAEAADGIVVDELGRAGPSGIVYAAGDVARFPAAALGTSMRVEHEDHANSHGFAVGANMAGAGEPYRHLPFFYSDLFDVGYEAVGEVDARRETVSWWREPLREGIVAYLDERGAPRGFLLWNLFGKVDQATALIAAAAPLEQDTLAALGG